MIKDLLQLVLKIYLELPPFIFVNEKEYILE